MTDKGQRSVNTNINALNKVTHTNARNGFRQACPRTFKSGSGRRGKPEASSPFIPLWRGTRGGCRGLSRA